jgi:hypothetical protein
VTRVSGFAPDVRYSSRYGSPHLWRAEERFKSGCATAGIKRNSLSVMATSAGNKAQNPRRGRDRATALNISHLKSFNMRSKHEVAVYDLKQESVATLAKEGAIGANDSLTLRRS